MSSVFGRDEAAIGMLAGNDDLGGRRCADGLGASWRRQGSTRMLPPYSPSSGAGEGREENERYGQCPAGMVSGEDANKADDMPKDEAAEQATGEGEADWDHEGHEKPFKAG